METAPLKPDDFQRSNLPINSRNLIDRGQNFNREGIAKDLTTSADIYNEIKGLYSNHSSRYNIITNM